jgi:hypothetical protein
VTINQAIRSALRKAKAEAKSYYVVYEAGEYQIADEVDLETWFSGVRDDQIVCCADSSGEIGA